MPAHAVQLDTSRLPDHLDRLMRAAWALCGNREDAEDLVQETYERVLRRPRLLRRRDADLPYLLRVLRTTWMRGRRERARRTATVELDEELIVVDEGSDPGVTAVEVRAAYAAIAELSEPLRETIVAVDVVGLSYKQAAEALRTREGTIMSRLFRARERVASAMEGGT